MTETKLLIGSLSNDLYRTAVLLQRGSENTANRFYTEAQRWTHQLTLRRTKPYIQKIITELNQQQKLIRSLENAEKLLMYSVLLQNYTLHMR